MPRLRNTAAAVALSLMTLLAMPAAAQVTQIDAMASQTAIMSAGSRASAVAKIKTVPSVGVVDLRIRTAPRFRTNLPDVSDYEVSAAKNAAGIRKLRAALKANPATRSALAKRGIPISRVVGIQVSSRGSIKVFLL